MLKVSNVARHKFATYLVAGTTLLAGAGLAISAKDDLKTKDADSSHTVTLAENNNKNNSMDLPLSDKTLAYGTMFTLGILGTGIASSKKNRVVKHDKTIDKILKDKTCRIKFEEDNKIQLVDSNGTPICYSSFELKGYSQNEIKEIIALTISNELKPKFIKKDDLEKPEVRKFQEEIEEAIRYSRKSIAERLKQEANISDLNAVCDANDLFRVMQNLPKEVKEEFIQLYLENGRSAFFMEKSSIMDPKKLQTALLERHGVSIQLIDKANDNITNINEDDENNENDENDEKNADFDNILITDKDGNSTLIESYYYPEILIEITQSLMQNNWKCK